MLIFCIVFQGLNLGFEDGSFGSGEVIVLSIVGLGSITFYSC